MKYLNRVRLFKLVPPGPSAREVLAERLRRRMRYGSLSDIPMVDKKVCKWCGVNPIVKGRLRFYCSYDCSESATAWVNPQKHTAKAYLLIVQQEGACARCKEDYSDEIDERIIDRTTRSDGKAHDGDTCELWQLCIGTGHKWHVDHVVPIHKGGDSIGLENMQVLCVRCHHRKTVEERRPESNQLTL